ncbi:MAG: hypothetical protein Q8P60_09040, partial [Pseudorhodobacter sp.]|nr:hypothetical protein [Pseudorhodobacter sp.]
GFSVTPAYLGVRYDAPASGVAQIRSGGFWGSFPQEYVDYLGRVGSAAYWYTSGGSSDRFKVTLPMTISYSAGAPVTPPAKPKSSTSKGGSTPAPPSAPPPPTDPPPADPPAQPVQPPPPGQPPSPALRPPDSDLVPSADAVATAGAAHAITARTDIPAVYALASTTAPNPDHRWHWWLGSLLLLGAAAAALLNITQRIGNR